MDNRITEYPLASIPKKVYLALRELGRGHQPDIQRSEGKLRKGKWLDTGPINEDEIASVCPDLPDTPMKGEIQ